MSPELKKLLIEWHDKAALESIVAADPAKKREALEDVAVIETVLFGGKPKAQAGR